MKLTLPKRENLIKTSWEDSLDLYYTPLIRIVYLHRFKMAVDLLEGKKYANLLDLGFGCGIFLKELARYADRLYGIDTHENTDGVRQMAAKEGFLADLRQGNIYAVPFAENQFDCVVSMSVLEHLTDLDRALSEIRRIAKKDADIILGFPVKNAFTDAFFKALGYSAKEIHPSDHREIIRAIKRHFKVVKVNKYPNGIPAACGLYWVVKSKKC